MGIFYFKIFTRNASTLTKESLNEIKTLSESYGFYMIIFLTPIIYIFWAAIVAKRLFGGLTVSITLESLLFCDLGLHVLIDLLDIAVNPLTHMSSFF